MRVSLKRRDLTSGSIFGNLLYFSVPYLISCFLQTFYGLADLFITGRFNGASTISAVAIGSQLMHMLTVIIVGLAMGATVSIGNAVGAKDAREAGRNIGAAVSVFAVFSVLVTMLLILTRNPILRILSTPPEAFEEAGRYVLICFIGVPFITAYNVISSIFRGLGDTKSPMVFVFAAGVINVILDYILIGPLAMGAMGAALATVISQALSVLLALLFLRNALKPRDAQAAPAILKLQDLKPDGQVLSRILKVGIPVACQDGLIQISFLVITAIANSRGVDVAAAVGIVEKIISFLFLVPSAMLSSVSAIAAQNAGAGEDDRALKTLHIAIGTCVVYGILTVIVCELWTPQIVGLFTDQPAVVTLGSQYLRSYAFDTIAAGVHFCYSGFFCAYGKAVYSFIHNIASIILMRIPGAWLASVLFPATLLPMGAAAPLGSLLSAMICIFLCRHMLKSRNSQSARREQ